MIIPKHLFEAVHGAKSREAPTNLKPVGTGPYKFVDFKPGDLVRGELNPNYHMPTGRIFDTIEMKGGGDADLGGARGAADRRVRLRLEPAGRGRDPQAHRERRQGPGRTSRPAATSSTSSSTSPTRGTRSTASARASRARTPFTDPAVREALNLLVDKTRMQEYIYGRAGTRPRNFLNNPPRFASPNTNCEFNVDKANALLDAAGWKTRRRRHPREGRQEAEVRLPDLDQRHRARRPSRSSSRPAQKAGIEIELKSVMASVFFSSDVANPDTYTQVLRRPPDVHDDHDAPDPEFFMDQFCSAEVSLEGEQVAGPQHQPLAQRGIRQAVRGRASRARPGQAGGALHPDERHAHRTTSSSFRWSAGRGCAAATSSSERRCSGWDCDFWALQDWYREYLTLVADTRSGTAAAAWRGTSFAPADGYEESCGRSTVGAISARRVSPPARLRPDDWSASA